MERINNRYTQECKRQAVEEYLGGARLTDVLRKYEIRSKSQLWHWRDQYLESGCFPDRRGKGSTGRPRKTDPTQMTKDEYIRYLEMELDVLKQLRSLSNNHSR